jgi:hypothetical protein
MGIYTLVDGMDGEYEATLTWIPTASLRVFGVTD